RPDDRHRGSSRTHQRFGIRRSRRMHAPPPPETRPRIVEPPHRPRDPAPMNTKTRSEILEGFRKKVAEGRPIIGGGAGTGLSAKCAEVGGIDLIIIYNSGRFRMAGRGSLAGLMPYGDANAIVMEMTREVLPVV